MIDLNVRVLTELSLRFVDEPGAAPGGILNVASVASFMPGPGMAVYHATKAYVLSFSEALHRELGGQGVRVTALCPGPVETEFMARAGIPENYFPRFLSRSAERVAQEGYDGLMRGRRVVIPGSNNKAAAHGSRGCCRAGSCSGCCASGLKEASRGIPILVFDAGFHIDVQFQARYPFRVTWRIDAGFHTGRLVRRRDVFPSGNQRIAGLVL